jgi:hypothetical protein
MKLGGRQHTQEPAKAAEAPVADLSAQNAAHALPDAFRAQAQAPLASELAEVLPVASGSPAVKNYEPDAALPPLPNSALRGTDGRVVEKLYHVTPVSNVKAILEVGLRPGSSNSSLEAVFLSQSPSTAENYKCAKTEPCVVLEIDARYIHPVHLGPDNYELQDWLDGLSERERDEVAGGAEHWSDFSGQESLWHCEQAAYYKTIPPEAIKVPGSKTGAHWREFF